VLFGDIGNCANIVKHGKADTHFEVPMVGLAHTALACSADTHGPGQRQVDGPYASTDSDHG
jgi:hypothetical protein